MMETQAKVSIQISANVNGSRGGGIFNGAPGEASVGSNFATLLFQNRSSQSFDSSGKSMQTLLSTTDSMVTSPEPLKGSDEQNQLQNSIVKQVDSQQSGKATESQSSAEQRQTERQHPAGNGKQVPHGSSQTDATGSGTTQTAQGEPSDEQVLENRTEHATETQPTESAEAKQVADADTPETAPVEPDSEVDALLVTDTSELETDGIGQPVTMVAATVQRDIESQVAGQNTGQRKVTAELSAQKSGDILSSTGVSEVNAEVDAKFHADLELDLNQDQKSKQLLDDLAMKMDLVSQRLTQGLEQILAKTPQGRGQITADAGASGQVKSLAGVQSTLHASSTGQTQLKSPILSEQSTFNVNVEKSNWGDAIRNRVMWMVNQGLQKAQIQLHPAELGAINVRVEVNADETHVTFTAQTSIAREALETEMGRLRELFQQQGIQLGEASVHDNSEQQQRSYSESIDVPLPGVDQTSDPTVADNSTPILHLQGMLDLYA
ncbi:MAG TPA: hypothetical protein DCZ03_16430 [Gammaproteobacteria bacterium]|nr:hypothetical protein [Gammaproteobacteria bacterium]